MDVEKLSKKKPLNAQPAKEQAPIEQVSSEKEISLDTKAPDLAAATEQPSSPQPFQLIPPFKISGKARGVAKAAGIDLSSIEDLAPRINAWAAEMEAFKNAVLAALPEIPAETVKVLRAEAQKQREAMVAQAAASGATAPQGGFDPNQPPWWMAMGEKILGGGSNPLQEKSDKLMGILLDRAMDAVIKPSAGATFERVFEEEMIKAKAKAAVQVLTQQ